MALSGSFKSSGWKGSSDTVCLLFSWTATQDKSNNQSTISWTLKGSRTASGWVKAGGFKVVIDGATVYSKSTDYRIELSNGTLVASGTKTISHNTDGSRSFSVSIEAGIYTFAVNCTGSTTFTLDTIPRASTISCTSANIGSAPTITVTRASSSFSHAISYSFKSLSGSVCGTTTATTITSWTIPDSFYAAIPNDKSGTCTLTCTTYNGSTPIGTSTCTFTVGTDPAKCSPTVTGTVTDTNTSATALTDGKKLIRYVSTAQCVITATANKSATIVERKICGTVISPSYITLNIPSVNRTQFEFYAKDSRGYTTTAIVTMELVPYVVLTANAEGFRPLPTDGSGKIAIAGNYFNGSFGSASNQLTVKYKPVGGSYKTATASISGNEYSAEIDLSGLTYTESFQYEVVVADKVASITRTLTIRKGIPVFDWGESSFRTNVPVEFAGGIKLNDQFADYVISRSTAAISATGTRQASTWYITRWASGFVELRAAVRYSGVACTSTWGSMYTGALPSQIAFPMKFESPPVVTVTAEYKNSNAWLATQDYSTSVDYTAKFQIVRPTSATVDVVLNYHAFGREA